MEAVKFLSPHITREAATFTRLYLNASLNITV